MSSSILQDPISAVPILTQPGPGLESVTSSDVPGAALRLAVAACGAARVKDAIRKGVPTVTTYRLDTESMGWSGPVRAAHEARLECENEIVFIDAKCAGPFRPLAPEIVRRRVGETLVRIALDPARPGGGSYLAREIDNRLAYFAKRLASLAERLESVTTTAQRFGLALPAFRRECEDLLTQRHEVESARDAIEAFRGAWLDRLATEANSVIDEVGLDTVTEGLREAILLARPGDGVSPALTADLADVATQLRALGLAPDGPAPGREGKRLQARHAATVRAIEADRQRHQAEVKARAKTLADGARSGQVDALQAVQEIATERGSAFPENFAKDLGGCALKAALAADPSAVYYLPL